MDAKKEQLQSSLMNNTEHESLTSLSTNPADNGSRGSKYSLEASSKTSFTKDDSVISNFDSRTELPVVRYNSSTSPTAAFTDTTELVNEIVPALPTFSDAVLMLQSNLHTLNPNSSVVGPAFKIGHESPANISSHRKDRETRPKIADVTTERENDKRHHRIKVSKVRWKDKKIRHFAQKGKQTTVAVNNPAESGSNIELFEKGSVATLEKPLLLGEPRIEEPLLSSPKSPIRSLQRRTHTHKHQTDSSQTSSFSSPVAGNRTLPSDHGVDQQKNPVETPQYRSRMLPDLELGDNVTVQEQSTKGPVSLRRYTTPKSHVKRTTEMFQFSQDRSTPSVCSDDPCGAGVACHPMNGRFLCLCSDHTEVDPGQPCPDIRPVNLTPPAIPAHVIKTGNEALNRPSQGFLLGAVITMGLCVFFLLSLIYWRRKKFCKLMRQRNALKLNKNPNESGAVKISTIHTFNFASNPNYYTSHPDQLPLQSLSVQLISKEQITFLGDLGEGCFGRVYKGEYDPRETSDYEDEDTDSQVSSSCLEESDGENKRTVDGEFENKRKKRKKERIVAVKVLKELVGTEAEADFMREVEIMASFRHPNILSLIGVVVAETGGTPWMVFEFMPYGDLAEVLRSCNKQYPANYVPMKPLNKAELLNICIQVALGMEYLSQHHFVHRDLACRNCLVGKNLTVKISDFGMSRDVYTCDYYKVGGSRMLPVRWMAPESILYGKFTLESDVWSFGVVLWEIYSYGKQPYYGNSNEEVVQLILQGILLSPSETCPQLVRDVMRLCWSTEAHNRLTFPEIVQRLKRAQEVLEEEQIFQELFPDLNYSQLCMHESPVKLQIDSDQYLLPTRNPVQDEYLTVLANP